MPYLTDFGKIDSGQYWFDSHAADTAVRYIETHCYHPKGALMGTPLILEEWQKDQIIRPLFGWKHKAQTVIKDKRGNVLNKLHRRKYTEAYIEIPKKNGKSTLASAIGQIFLDIEPEKGGEIVGLAYGRDQAKIIFEMVAASINASPRMKRRGARIMQNVIRCKDKRYKVWSKEAGSQDGQSPNLVLVDELHVHKKPDLYDMATKSTAARVNPLVLNITTAGDNLYGIGFETHKRAKAVALGEIADETLLVCMYGAEPEDDPLDENTWIKCNPNYYAIPAIQSTLMKEATKARNSAAALNSFKRYHLNVWNNDKSAWINSEVWNDSQWDYDLEDLDRQECWGGLDLSSKNDITGFCLVFPVEITEEVSRSINDKLRKRWNGDGEYKELDYTDKTGYITLNWYFLPEAKEFNDEGGKKLRMYYDWVNEGKIIETPGNVVDYRHVRDFIVEQAEKYNIQSIAFDPHNANTIVPELEENDLDMIQFAQRPSLIGPACEDFEGKVLSGLFNHLGDPVLSWMNGNTTAIYDGQNKILRVAKKDRNDVTCKIDGMVANVMALSQAVENENSSGVFVDFF